ncbi:MAG: HAMP domain-containing sensor histidine kinase [bacterium]|nr:HAMP domain-containing sensor histidine kinase [bacterium]
MSLRSRLLASYFLLLTVTLSVIAFALFLFLNAQPEPRFTSYLRLSSVGQGLNLVDVLTEPRPTESLSEFAESASVRVMALTVNENQFEIAFDSAGDFTNGSSIELGIDTSYTNSRAGQARMGRGQRVYGNFYEDEQEWLYAAVISPDRAQRGIWLLVAEPRPTQSLPNTLQQFGATLGIPLVQSALAGMLAAVVMAALITRTIARPLQALSNAATSVAQGHFDELVPVSGPTEIRAVAEAFNRMSGEVRASQQAQRDFLANVSHDLKTPLTSIQGYSQAIMDGATKDPAHAAEIIHDEAARLNRMVIELTDLARIQSGRLSMQMVALDLGQITQRVAKKLEVVAQKKGIVLDVHAPSLPDIAGDGDRLVQVLHNLIDNAIKYTPSGGKVQVRAQVGHNGVEVIVADTGMGIPEADLPRVFERFYQVDKARGPARGTGLGLAIVREIVQAHGGRIRVQSQAEQGTTFTVWLPSPNVSTVARGR